MYLASEVDSPRFMFLIHLRGIYMRKLLAAALISAAVVLAGCASTKAADQTAAPAKKPCATKTAKKAHHDGKYTK